MGNNFSSEFSRGVEDITPFFYIVNISLFLATIVTIYGTGYRLGLVFITSAVAGYFLIFYTNKEYWFGNDNEHEASLLLLNPIGFLMKPVVDSKGILTNINFKYWGFIILSLMYWILVFAIFSYKYCRLGHNYDCDWDWEYLILYLGFLSK